MIETKDRDQKRARMEKEGERVALVNQGPKATEGEIRISSTHLFWRSIITSTRSYSISRTALNLSGRCREDV
jgi:hypothetical protein